jgi:hypothetical protein
VEAVCYDHANHAYLLGIVAAGNQCLQSDPVVTPASFPWYRSPVLWFSVGLIVGGVGIGYIATR